jgi:hypothetical protein
MNTWVRRSLKAGALTAGAVMATGTAAYADTTVISTGNTGVLNGTQAFAPIQAPINICGVAAGVAGDAFAGCTGGSAASVDGLYDARMISSNNHGILNGTQIFAPIQAPINVCGVAVGVLGDASAGCEGGASAKISGKHKHHHHHNCGCRHDHDDHDGYGRESVTEAASQAELLGNSLPLVGDAGNSLPLVGGLTNGGGLSRLPLVGSLTNGSLTNGGLTNGGLGGLTNSGLPLVGPLLGGVLGGQSRDGVNVDALDAVGTVSPVRRATESEGDDSNHSNGGNGGGNGHHPTPRPRPRPCTPCHTPPPPPCHTPPPPPCHDHHHGGHHHGRDVTLISSGNHGILNGTQVYAPIQAPINVSGVTAGVLGDANAWSVGGSSARQ